MRSVKQEPGAAPRQTRRVALRQQTPLTIEDDVNVETDASTAPSSARSNMTDATFSNEDVASPDTAMSDIPVAEDPLYLFGRKGRELIQGINKLDCLGIDTTLPSLPKVVAVGDQSAGKSSIIEAMSDITLPRSEGTCTRCPFQITTHATQDGDLRWSCTISLQSKYSYLPGYKGDGTGLAGWKAYGSTEICQFATITNKADLELVLRRAQIAILNPTKNWRHFTACSATEVVNATFQVDFSPNLICLEINAPNLLELSFYDLPGAINVMHDESQDYLSEFVETLLKTYLNDDQALVVIACPANQDIETGTAFKYLRNCKASGRAIGVLTKPDLVDPTETRISSLERMFQGEAFKLDGGWFTTKQLSQSQLNGPVRPTYEKARAEEAAFFSTAPWSARLSKFADRFGVSNLQEAVSRRHIKHILACLPDIVGRVRERLLQVQHELKEYPEKATNPGLEIIYDIDNIVKAVVVQCSPDSKTSPFRASQRDYMKQLAKQLHTASPKVELATPGYVKPALVIDDSDMNETPSKRSKMDDGRAVSATPRRAIPSSSQATSRTPVTGSKRKATRATSQAPASHGVTFRLDEVKRRFDLAPSVRLPDDADVRITYDLAKEALSCFSTFTQQTMDKFEALVTKMLDGCLVEALAQRQGTLLYDEASSIIQGLFVELFNKEMDALHHYVACLTHRPITYGKNWWSAKKEEQHQKLRQGRDEARVLEHFEVMEENGYKVPPSIEERKKKVADATWVANNIRSPAFTRELKELAMPLTFYELASSQLVDTVARNLDYLVYQLEDRMKTQLLNGLRPDDFDHCASLLAEDPQREQVRVELEAEQSKLEEALSELKILSNADA
ncbi:putative dynamin stalk domain, dynamin, GTPase domain, GTPase effector domain-containing protein [Septoria linicola]|nr:putative dynamin stalk domain, dynamin, GTPase domain, GTPase effector domain-containing protein [Septoria linicola]